MDFEEFIGQKLQDKIDNGTTELALEVRKFFALRANIRRLSKENYIAYCTLISDTPFYRLTFGELYRDTVQSYESKKYKIYSHEEAKAFLEKTAEKAAILKSKADACSLLYPRKYAKLAAKREFCERKLKIEEDLQKAQEEYKKAGGDERYDELIHKVAEEIVNENKSEKVIDEIILKSIASGGGMVKEVQENVHYDIVLYAAEYIGKKVAEVLKTSTYKREVTEVKKQMSGIDQDIDQSSEEKNTSEEVKKSLENGASNENAEETEKE